MSQGSMRTGELARVADALRRGELNPVAYAEETCGRIEAANPDLSAFVPEDGRRERVRALAEKLVLSWPDGAGRAGHADHADRPALFGVPLGVKDVLRVDGLPTGAGSEVPADALAGPEAVAVARLRAAGALVAGKTVTAEFAFMSPGPTRNPHALGHSPGGSSSGSAAAVAAGLVPLALGTQTVGSVIRPAAFCGIVGFKPSFGRIPTDGVIANAPTFDTVGLFSQDVAGTVLAAEVLCDGWRTTRAGGSGPPAPPVLGVPDGPYLRQATPEAREVFAAQLARLAAAGIEVRQVPALADIAAVNARNSVINLVELARTHERLFPEHGDRYRDETATAIRDGRQIEPSTYTQALAARADYAAALVARMDEAGIDAWIAPAATGPAPEGITTTGSPAMNLPWTQARLPVVGLPAGVASNGLPLGVQCVARPGADEDLLGWAGTLAPLLSGAGGGAASPAG